MELDRNEVVSAEVILGPPQQGALITSENLDQYRPSAAAATTATSALAAAGFQVGPVVGIGFSITGSIHTFEVYFRTKLRPMAGGGIGFAGAEGATSFELPSALVPADLRETIRTVTFVPPPDFGPQGFMA